MNGTQQKPIQLKKQNISAQQQKRAINSLNDVWPRHIQIITALNQTSTTK